MSERSTSELHLAPPLIQRFTTSWMPLVKYVRSPVVIKCCFMWSIHSCDLMWARVCAVDTIIFENSAGLGSQRCFSLSRKWAAHHPRFSVIYFKSKVLKYLDTWYVCWLKHSIIYYSPKCNHGRLWDFYLVVKERRDHSDSERGNTLLSLHGLLFPISSKGTFICTLLQKGSTYHSFCSPKHQSWSTDWN